MAAWRRTEFLMTSPRRPGSRRPASVSRSAASRRAASAAAPASPSGLSRAPPGPTTTATRRSCRTMIAARTWPLSARAARTSASPARAAAPPRPLAAQLRSLIRRSSSARRPGWPGSGRPRQLGGPAEAGKLAQLREAGRDLGIGRAAGPAGRGTPARGSAPATRTPAGPSRGPAPAATPRRPGPCPAPPCRSPGPGCPSGPGGADQGQAVPQRGQRRAGPALLAGQLGPGQPAQQADLEGQARSPAAHAGDPRPCLLQTARHDQGPGPDEFGGVRIPGQAAAAQPDGQPLRLSGHPGAGRR